MAEKLIIDRRRWLRGEGPMPSVLLRPYDGKMCCLGFEMLRRGATELEITNLKTPAKLERMIPGLTVKTHIFDFYQTSVVCDRLMQANDNLLLGSLERERLITQHFAEIGVEVEFIN